MNQEYIDDDDDEDDYDDDLEDDIYDEGNIFAVRI